MHILIVAPEQIPVPGSGSVEICILSIAKQLALQHKVTIISKRSYPLPLQSHISNVTIVRVTSGSAKTYIASVLHYMKGKSFDFIQVDNRPSYMAQIKKEFPRTLVSIFLHSLTFVPNTAEMTNNLRKADLIIANSSSLQQKLTSRFPDIASKIHTVELGVDTSRFRPATRSEQKASKRHYRIRRAFTILFVGRVIPRKGVPVLIKAAHLVRKHTPIHLIIVGKGNPSYIRRLRLQAYKLGVPITFTGKKSHEKIHKIYRAADCFVCPSQKHEAFGLVNVEAMASGVPVIASRIGGIQEVVKHEHNGYLVDRYQKPSEFAYYLIRLAKNPTQRDKLSANGRNDVLQHFTWSQTSTKLAAIYSKAITS
ncbi:spore coat protein SA [Paenibacillus sp. DS2015]|uniref:glycosyltransferase family 4 protein n=1 Tax=Paenibacillus sp. DS2015 TaxID=3373917 RepID=UPI003D256B79